MVKLLVKGAVAALIAFSVVGCGGTPPPAPKVASNIPEWIDNPDSIEGISAVGEAAVGAAGWGFAKTEATANARDAISRQLNIKVKNMISNFTQTTGVGTAQTVDKVTKNVSKQLAKVDLSGSKVAKTYRDREYNVMYVLVKLDPSTVANVQKVAKDAAISSYKNDKALYQQFMDKKAGEALDAQIDKEMN